MDSGYHTTSNTDLNNELSNFIDYVDSFYGQNDPVYPMKSIVGDLPLDKSAILDATYEYLSTITKRKSDTYTWGGGDSLDRERVRDILLNSGYFLTHLQHKEF